MKPQRVHISVQLDPKLLKAASHRAVDLGITRTELINRAVEMFLYGCDRTPVSTEMTYTGAEDED